MEAFCTGSLLSNQPRWLVIPARVGYGLCDVPTLRTCLVERARTAADRGAPRGAAQEKLESSEAQVRELTERLELLQREKLELEMRSSALAAGAGGASSAGLLVRAGRARPRGAGPWHAACFAWLSGRWCGLPCLGCRASAARVPGCRRGAARARREPVPCVRGRAWAACSAGAARCQLRSVRGRGKVGGLSVGARVAQQAGSGEDEDAAYFDSLSAFVGKVRGEPFPREAAHNMTFKDVARNVEVRGSAPKGPATRVGVADGLRRRSARKGVGWGCA